jgi:hypothetical protein
MHARATNSPTSTSIEIEEGNPISDSSKKSTDRMSEERKKSSGANTQDDTDANCELDSPAVEEPAANEGTSSSAPPPKKRLSLKPRMEREAELLNVDGLKHDLSRAKRIPKKAALAPVESSSSNTLDSSATNC